ncbi:MAG: A/G-specific adenine glycosylase [Sphingomicrobium sp.]
MTANDVTRLLQHYVDNSRLLPWRSPPGGAAPDPYRIWLSEIMLQQTTVAAVTPRFERILKLWPTLDALAAARDEDVLSEWAGLGYYARARNLVACARQVADMGGFPATSAELRKLPGIGAYTSAAIAAIAFGEPAAAVDTNIARVISRYYALANPGRAELERQMAAIVALGPPAEIVQAMMDLGASICLPAKPRCDLCPLHGGCGALAAGDPEAFPRRKPKAVRPRRCGVVYWIERDDCLWLVRRPPSGLLGGMAALPGDDWSSQAPAATETLASVRHVFTHFALELAVVARTEPIGAGWWQCLNRIAEAGLPTLYRRAVDAVLKSRPMRSETRRSEQLEEAPSGP